MNTRAFVVFVTAPSHEVASKLARSLVTSRLAACVNILPGITSIYKWEGKVNEEKEVMLVIKTTQNAMPALTEHIKSKHPYDVPEVIGWPIQEGSENYLKWVTDEVCVSK